ncbi:hypothetical protein ACFQ3N_05355 [Virgibacillus byunsanensis]|uniref:Uracil-DNA glycosylase n=1 Tax=Virgibacillus byunsanensis TaxID=570945 RepID=A0ABW3LHG0_9BACI
MKSRFHCCATCEHFRIEKQKEASKRIYCKRLGFDTKPTYQFDCWEPKERVKKSMKKEESRRV